MSDARKQDRALELAFNTAAHASFILSEHNDGKAAPAFNFIWPCLGVPLGPHSGLTAASDALAPFVRANRDAPPEALYIHARASGVHACKTPWAVLPLNDAFAYALFVMVLNQADTRIADEAAAKAQAARDANPPKLRKPHRDDHVMEGFESIHDRVVLSADPRSRRKPKLSLPQKGK